MKTHNLTPITYSIHREGDSPMFGESSIHVSLEDEGGGEFLIITQNSDNPEAGVIRLDFEELPLILEAAKLLKQGIEKNANDK